MFWRLDEAVVAATRRLVHSWQHLTGQSPFVLIRCACLCIITSTLLHLTDYWFDILPNRTSALDVFICLISLALMLAYISGTHSADTAWRNGSDALPWWMGHAREHPIPLFRLTFFLISVVLGTAMAYIVVAAPSLVASYMKGYHAGIVWLARVGTPAITAMLYLMAVDPLPPGRSKVAQWLAAFRTRLMPATAGAD